MQLNTDSNDVNIHEPITMSHQRHEKNFYESGTKWKEIDEKKLR